LRKQQNLLTEVIVLPAIKQNLLSESDIDNEIVIVDGALPHEVRLLLE
jgi:hypothetical protein